MNTAVTTLLSRINRRSKSAKPDFRQLLGEDDWRRLPVPIRERFSEQEESVGAVTYTGVMTKISSNPWGWLLAQICRLFGTPLPPFNGVNIPTNVKVYEEKAQGGVVWERCYVFNKRKPVKIRSIKRLDKSGSLVECVGGMRMRLSIYEESGELHFVSNAYYWELINLSIPLPTLFTPGTTHVIHSEAGNGIFRFKLTMTHPLLGKMFYQDGYFINATHASPPGAESRDQV